MSNLKSVIFISLTLFTADVFAAEAFGTFASVKGSVQVVVDTKKSQPKVGDKIFQGSTVETGANGRAKIIMSDRSVVHVSPESNVKIAAYGTTDGKKNVEVQLSQGKIRSEIKGSYGESNKFLIKTPTAVAGVRGTDFLVNHDVKTNTTELTTFRGVVELTPVKNGVPSGPPVLIKQNQKSTVSAEKPAAPPQTINTEERNKLDAETKSTDAPAASAPSANQETNSGGDGSSSAPAGSSTPASDKKRLGDTKDTVPENFDQLPKSPNAAAPQPPSAQPNRFMPPPPNPRLNDAIRDKTDKTNVKIIPKGP